MKVVLRHLVSPRYDHRKLEPPFYRDVVDVFEDRMRGWLLAPAVKLLESSDFSVASVALVSNYFEGIEIYHSGTDSEGQSKAFFRRGFSRVFIVRNQFDGVQQAIATRLYELLRCGFAHDSMFRSGIYFSTLRSEPILVSQRKKNGSFDMSVKPDAIVINPRLFVEGIERHFTMYVRELRRGNDQALRKNFEAAIAIKWRLNEPGPYMGMTEEEFVNGSLPE